MTDKQLTDEFVREKVESYIRSRVKHIHVVCGLTTLPDLYTLRIVFLYGGAWLSFETPLQTIRDTIVSNSFEQYMMSLLSTLIKSLAFKYFLGTEGKNV